MTAIGVVVPRSSSRERIPRSLAAIFARLAALAVHRPRLVVFGAIVVTALLGVHAPGLRVDGSIEALLPEDDPDRVVHAEIEATFGADAVTRIGLFADDVFTPETLREIDRLSRELAALEGVERVLDLTTVRDVEMTGAGLRVGPLLAALPGTLAEARRFRETILSDPVHHGSLVAPDGSATAITIFYEPMSDARFTALGLEERVREIVDRREGLALAGIPTLKAEGARRMEADIRIFSAVGFVVVILVLAVTFRRARDVAIALVPLVMGVSWTNGMMALLDWPVTIGSLVLNPLLMAIGVAYSIHVLARHRLESRTERDGVETALATLKHVGRPVAIAAVTTLLGFATLVPHPVPTIRDLGVWSVFGVAVIALASLVVVPALLVLFPRRTAVEDGGGRFDEALARLADLTSRRPRAVVAAGLLLCLVSVGGVAQIRVETDYVGFFDPDSRVRRDADRIAAGLAGTRPLYVVVEGAKPRTFSRPEVLAGLDRLETFLAGRTGVDATLSILDSLRTAHAAIVPEAAGRLPATRDEADQLLVLLDPTETRPLLTRDGSRANLILYTTLSSSSEVERLVRETTALARTVFPPDVRVRVTGTVVLLNRASDTIAHQQLVGLARMIVVLFVVLSLLFASVRIGLLSLVPNVFPIVVLFGVMGWTGTSLNVATSMIAVIALGIAVDDTVHYLSALSTEAAAGPGAVRRAIRTVGRPIVFTSVALAAGFLVSCLSGFLPVRQFGALAALTMALALVADLLLTPAIATLAGARLGILRGVRPAKTSIPIIPPV